MRYAEITGWGKCHPPASLHNDDIATFVDTSDEWIYSRSGIHSRYVSHAPNADMAFVAASRALACAGLEASALDLVVFGSTTADENVPNTASLIKNRLGADNAAAFDLNAACCSFLYGLNAATDMIRSGSLGRALVIGSERLVSMMDWDRRESAVLFGDGAGAVVVEPSEQPLGLLQTKLGCVPHTRELLQMKDFGAAALGEFRPLHLSLDFEGRSIFRHAVTMMGEACEEVLRGAGLTLDDIDLMVPHQANQRIIEALGKRMNLSPERVVLILDRYANTSASTIPLTLCEALESGRVRPGMLLLTAVFGAGLTWGAGVIRWGERVEPLGSSDAELPPCDRTGLELVREFIALRAAQR